LAFGLGLEKIGGLGLVT